MTEGCKHPCISTTPFEGRDSIFKLIALHTLVWLWRSLILVILWGASLRVDRLVHTHIVTHGYWTICHWQVANTHVKSISVVKLSKSVLSRRRLCWNWACTIKCDKRACTTCKDELIMKLVISNFSDPVTALIIIKREQWSIWFSYIPDSDCSIRSTGR